MKEIFVKKTVSDVIAHFFQSKKIPHVFGIIGAGNAHIFDAIHTLGHTNLVCVHHEQAATMAIQTYFRVSGVVTAAVLTTGAGSLNGVTGVVSAWADSIPCLIISSNENSRHTHGQNPLRMWGIQGYDSVAMVEKVTKYAVRITDPTKILFELEKAYHLASTGRQGPCWLDIPMNIQSAVVEESLLPSFIPNAPVTPSAKLIEDVRQIWSVLSQCKRPVLWLGHGIRLAGAQPLLEPLLALAKFPVLLSWAGIDMLDSHFPLVYGRAGVYGQRCANFVLQNCDGLLTLGTRLAIPQVGYDMSEFCRDAQIMAVDIDVAELDKHKDHLDIAIPMDAKVFLEISIKILKQGPLAAPRAWIDICDTYRQRFPWVGPEHKEEPGKINSYRFMDKLNGYLKPDQIIVTDMGTALLSGHQTLKINPGQRLMTSTGLGEMGYGLPAAIGASFARNRGEVLCLNCDGGMMMNLQEIQTIVHHRLPIKIIIFNNDGYLMIKHTQKALFQGRYSGTNKDTGVSCPDFSKLAKAFDIPSFQIRTWGDFDRTISSLMEEKGPVICEVFMDPEQPFFPKLSLSSQKDGTIISPPLEDLSPLLSREELQKNMIIPLHPKSEKIRV